jgi:YggT family protein
MFIFQLLSTLISIYQLIVLARVLLSWFPDIDRSNPLVQMLYDLTEPVLRPIREALPQGGMAGLDFSPMILLVGLYVLQIILPG